MNDPGTKTLGELIFQEGLVEQEQFDAAKTIHEATGKTISSILVETGAISEDAKNTLLKKRFGIEAVVIEAEKRDESTLSLIPRREAARHRCVPLRLENDALVVAFEEPNNSLLVEYLRTLAGHRITPVATSSADIDRALKTYPDDERKPGIRMDDKPFVVRALVSIVSAFLYLLVPLAVGVAMVQDIGGFQAFLGRLGSYEIGFYTFLVWGMWILVIWYIQGLIFAPKD